MDTFKLMSEKVDFIELQSLIIIFNKKIASKFMELLNVPKTNEFDFQQISSKRYFSSLSSHPINFEEANKVYYYHYSGFNWIKFYTLYGIIVIESRSNNIRISTCECPSSFLHSFNDSPSVLEFNAKGTLLYCCFHRKGLLHRLNNSAYISYYSIDRKKRLKKEWWLNGRLHNTTGPAKIINEDGVCINYYYIDNRQIDVNEFVSRQIFLEKELLKSQEIS